LEKQASQVASLACGLTEQVEMTVLRTRDLRGLREGGGLFLLLHELDFDDTGKPIRYRSD